MSIFEFKPGQTRLFSHTNAASINRFPPNLQKGVTARHNAHKDDETHQVPILDTRLNAGIFDLCHIPVDSNWHDNSYVNTASNASGIAEPGSASCLHPSAEYSGPLIQTRLKFGKKNDKYELEAEQAADNIMKSDVPAPQHAVGLKSENRVQCNSIAGEPSGSISTTPLMTPRLTGHRGQPLADHTRAFMEPRLAYDFSHVRIHKDAATTEMNQQLKSRAFTYGSNIYFNRGEYNPHTSTGKRLLAHELSHVIQQAGRSSTAPDIQCSAIASWEGGTFDQRVETKRESLGLDFNTDSFKRKDPISTAIEKSIHRRQQRQFDRKASRADPIEYQTNKQQIEADFSNKPKKMHRKLNRLKKKFDKANKQLALPELPKVLVISAEYHYLPINSVNQQIIDFPDSAIEEAKKKFRVGGTWKDIEYNGSKIAVRFDIKFTKHTNATELLKYDNQKIPGHVPMRTKNIPNEGAEAFSFDFTADTGQEKEKVTGEGGRFAEANANFVNIDTQAIRNKKTTVKFFRKDSDRDGGVPVTKSEKISGKDYSLLMASFIAHEIGHNIGMMHDDLGVMVKAFKEPKPSLIQTGIADSNGQIIDTIYELDIAFPNIDITEKNVRLLVSRIDQMTEQQGLYWKNELDRRNNDIDPANDIQSTEGLKDSGITSF